MDIEELKEELKRMLRDAQSLGDTEASHIMADDALCILLKELGHNDIVDEFEKVKKWYA